MHSDDFKVLIIGGGNCGLAVATGLKKAGIPYTVFERDDEHKFIQGARDWGSLLHWATEYFEKLLPEHLRERIKEPRVDPSLETVPPVPQLHAATGDIMHTIETPVITRVSRKKLRLFFTQGENLNIQFGKKLNALSVQEADVVADFEDGTTAAGSMAVGCDGSHSLVREFLVGHEAALVEDLDLTMINGAAEGYTSEQALLLRSVHPLTQLAMLHPDEPGNALLATLDVPDPKDPATWRFQPYTSWRGPPHAKDLEDPVTRMEFVRERMAQFCEPFRTSFLALSEDKVMPVFPGNQWAPRIKWDNHGGRVTLAGDAAHAMLPHRGQGLNNAIKDASDIVDVIKAAVSGTKSLKEGMTEYEEEMRARGTREVELSHQQMLANESPELLKKSPMFTMGVGRNDGK